MFKLLILQWGVQTIPTLYYKTKQDCLEAAQVIKLGLGEDTGKVDFKIVPPKQG